MALFDVSFAILLLGGAVLIFVQVAKLLSITVTPVILVLAIVIASGLAFHHPDSVFFLPSDGLFYSAWGVQIAGEWEQGQTGLEGVWPGRGAIALLIALFHSFLGAHEVAMISIGAVTTASSFLLLRMAAEILFPGRIGAFSPPLLFLAGGAVPFFGGGILRESYFWLGISLITLSITLIFRHQWPAFLATFVSGALIVTLFRPDFGVLLSASSLSIALVLIAQMNFRRRQFVVGNILLGASLGSLGSAPFLLDLVRPGITPSGLVTISGGLSNSEVATAFVSNATHQPVICDTYAFVKALCMAGANLPYALLGPFPQDLELTITSVVLTASTWAFGLMALLVFGSFLLLERSARPVALAFVALSAISILVSASTLTNYGILWRFKPSALMFTYPLVFMTWASISAKFVQAIGAFRGHGATKG